MSDSESRRSSGRMPAVGGGTGSSTPFTAEIQRRPDGLLIVTIGGQANATMAMNLRMKILFEGSVEGTDLIFDASRLDGISAEFTKPFAEIMARYKSMGGGRVMCVAERQNVRMSAENLNMASISADGPTIEMVDVLGVAIAKLGRTIDGGG